MKATGQAEMSAISRSVTENVDGGKAGLITGTYKKIDQYIFPIYEECLKVVKIPIFLYQFFVYFTFCQVIGTSLWPPILNYIDFNEDSAGKFFYYYFCIFFMCDINDSYVSNVIVIIVLSIFVFFICLANGSMMAYYKHHRRFIRWVLYLTRFSFEFIPFFIMIPLSRFVGMLLLRLCSTPTIDEILIFIFSLIYYAFFTYIYYVTRILLSLTPYLSVSPTACWDGFFMFLFPTCTGLSQLLGYFLTLFDNYIMVIWILFMIAFSLFVIISAGFQPYVKLNTNAIIGSLFASHIMMDVIAIIYLISNKKPSNLSLALIPFFLIFVFVFILKFIYNLVNRNTKKIMYYSTYFDDENFMENHSEQNENSPNAQFDTTAVFNKHKLFKSKLMCNLFLRVGLTEACPMFLDMSLIKYIMNHHPDFVFLCMRFVVLFPGESHILSYLYRESLKMRSYNISQRFLLYQVNKVRNLRQSSASSEVTEQIGRLQALSKQVISEVRSFWKTIPDDPCVFYDLKIKTDSLVDLYEESLEKWPNSIKLHDDLNILLIEGAMDFHYSASIKNRQNLVELGRNFAIDYSFKSLIKAYPFYLKKNIIDSKGRKGRNFLTYTANKRPYSNFEASSSSVLSSSSKTSSSMHDSSGNSDSKLSTGTLDGELDIEIEEKIAKSTFTYPRLRLAYEKALKGRHSHNSMRLKIAAFWTLFLVIASLITSFVVSYGAFDAIIDGNIRMFYYSSFRLEFDNMLTVIVMNWFKRENVIDENLYNAMLKPGSLEGANYQFSQNEIDLTYSGSGDIYSEAFRWLDQCISSFELFIDSTVQLASQRDDVLSIMGGLLESLSLLTVCNDGVPIGYGNFNSLQSIFSYVLQLSSFIILDSETNQSYDYGNSDLMCEIVGNIAVMQAQFDNLSTSMYDSRYTNYIEIEDRLYLILILFAVCLFVLTEPFLIIFLTLFFRDIYKMLHMMKNIDLSVQQEASKHLTVTEHDDGETNTIGYQPAYSISKVYYYVNIFIPATIGIGLFVGSFFVALNTGENLLQIAKWTYFCQVRAPYAVEIYAITAFCVALSSNSNLTQMIGFDMARPIVDFLIYALPIYQGALMQGQQYENVTSILGKSEEFDEINTYDKCNWEMEYGNVTFLNAYRCYPLSRIIQFYCEHAENILLHLTNESFGVNSPIYYLWDMLNYHILDDAARSLILVIRMGYDELSNLHTYMGIICFGGIALLVLCFIFFMLELKKLDYAYDGALMLLKRLPPPDVISNPELYSFLIGNSNDKKNGNMTVAKSAIHLSKDAVICLSRMETIEIVNQSVTNLFGYMPDQLLGQPISVLLQENKIIDQQFNLMRNGEASMVFECSTKATSDDDQLIPVHLYLLGIAENNQAKSFVVIMRDETTLLKKIEDAEKAKERSEKLLFQILPRNIITRINEGETDISFSVPIATVIFIDIVRFSDYSATLSPSQIMENISVIFSNFDTRCAKYEYLTKIKLIGDVYMAAAGLFEQESLAGEAAIQSINFGIEALQALDESNSILDSSLQVRIGMNTDGPIIAGVLGLDKPVFDIIGDPINVASRLQSNGIPGTIQISQSTYDYVQKANFIIEQRGEINLKGKGKKMAYIVHPPVQDSFNFHELIHQQSSILLDQQTIPYAD